VVELGEIQAAAKKLAVAVNPVAVRDPQGFESAFATIQAGDSQALVSLSDPLMMFHRQEIAHFALRQRLPSMYPFSHYVREGGLMSYGSDLMASYRRYGYFIDKIAKGTRAGDIPIEEPAKFELIINLKTAKALGLTIPPSVLARADEVIE
jgi:putative ABC transport system substrate-binding protein